MELFTIIVCDPDFAVSKYFEPKIVRQFFLALKSLHFCAGPNSLKITMLLTFEIFGHARNHGKKFPRCIMCVQYRGGGGGGVCVQYHGTS